MKPRIYGRTSRGVEIPLRAQEPEAAVTEIQDLLARVGGMHGEVVSIYSEIKLADVRLPTLAGKTGA